MMIGLMLAGVLGAMAAATVASAAGLAIVPVALSYWAGGTVAMVACIVLAARARHRRDARRTALHCT